jgi:uncharacterized repeat protein (TIGR02543 family)
VEYGGQVEEPDPAPKREGYTLDGWYTQANGGSNKYNFNTPVTGGFTLYARWKQDKYTVTFDLNYTGAPTAPQPQTVAHGAKASEPTPKRTGYRFDGWYRNNQGTGAKWNFASGVTSNLDLYAKWKPITLAAVIAEILIDAAANTDKTYTLPSGDEDYNAEVTLTTANSPATVVIDGGNRVITGSANSITVGAGVSLTLQNITFTTLPFIVEAGGKFVLGNNVTISKTSGSGVEVTGGTLTMNGSALINGNNGTGVGVIVSAGLFNMNGGTISANMGNVGQYQYGGGVRVNGTNAKFNMGGGLISGNTAQAYTGYINSHAGGGGGVYVSGSGAEFNMSGGEISNNTTKALVDGFGLNEGGEGGGVFIEGYDGDPALGYAGYATRPLFNMTGGTIKNNTTTDAYASGLISNGYAGVGGGVSVWRADFKMSGTITTTEISGNKTGSGGGVYLGYNSTFTMEGGRITGNVADLALYDNYFAAGGEGGGVFMFDNCSFTMSGGKISGNEAERGGGGVYIGYNSSFAMNGGEIGGDTAEDANKAGEYGGGGVYRVGTLNGSGTAGIHGNTQPEVYPAP